MIFLINSKTILSTPINYKVDEANPEELKNIIKGLNNEISDTNTSYTYDNNGNITSITTDDDSTNISYNERGKKWAVMLKQLSGRQRGRH